MVMARVWVLGLARRDLSRLFGVSGAIWWEASRLGLKLSLYGDGPYRGVAFFLFLFLVLL